MKKVFSVLAAVAFLVTGFWAQEAGAQTGDIPDISITGPDFVYEGEPATFTISSHIRVATNLTVRIGGNAVPHDSPFKPGFEDIRPFVPGSATRVPGTSLGYTPWGDVALTVVIPAGSQSVQHTIMTTNQRGQAPFSGYHILEVRCPSGESPLDCARTSSQPEGAHPSGYTGSAVYTFEDTKPTDGDWADNSPSEHIIEIRRVAPPEISITSEDTLNSGDTAAFTITAGSTVPVGGLVINLDVSDPDNIVQGTAPATVTLPHGQTGVTYSLPTQADNTGTLAVSVGTAPTVSVTRETLPNGETPGTAITSTSASTSTLSSVSTYTAASANNRAAVTVEKSLLVEQANRIILPRLAMTIADETATSIGDRIRSVFGGGGDDGVTLRGSDWRQFIASQAAGSGEHAELPDVNLSDFAFAVAADTAGWSGGWSDFGGGFLKDLSVWGRGYYRSMDVGEDIEFDGGITGGMIGVDAMIKPNLLSGVSFNMFLSDLDFNRGSRTGTHETTAWSVHPYIGWNPTPRTTLWGTIGYGMGGAEVKETGETALRDRDIMLMTFGGGGSGELFNRRVGRGRVSVDAVGDVVFARLIEDGNGGLDADGGRVRLGLEMAASRPVWRSNLGGSIEMAYRGDFGDALRGSGFEVAGGLKVGVPSIGLRIDGEARALMSHTDSVKERGFTGDITWSPGDGAQGPFVSFNPQWGATNDKRETLWNQGAGVIAADAGGGLRYGLEFGYGVPLPYESGLMKVFARSEIEDGAVSSKTGGLDVTAAGGISAGYEAVDETAQAETEHRAYIRFNRAF